MKLIQLAAIFAALFLAGCSDPEPPIPLPTSVLAPSAGQGMGIDMASDSSDVLNELADAQVKFVARYYRDPGSRWPALSPTEAQRLSSSGLKIVAVYEYHSPRPWHFTYEGGYSDALTAYGEAKAVGQPVGSAIYFAADFHARDYHLASVVDYFRGIHAGLAAAGAGKEDYAVGVYGSAPVCQAVKEAGLARYSWLSGSINWNDGIDYEGWDIMQGGSLPELSFRNDADEARSDYGGFDVSPPTLLTQSAPAPASNPVPAAPTVTAATPVAASPPVTAATPVAASPPATALATGPASMSVAGSPPVTASAPKAASTPPGAASAPVPAATSVAGSPPVTASAPTAASTPAGTTPAPVPASTPAADSTRFVVPVSVPTVTSNPDDMTRVRY